MDKELTAKEKYLKSKTGKRLFKEITEIYDNCKVMVQIYEALGISFDELDFMIVDVSRQLFPQTATWGLSIWEQRLKLPTNKDLSDEERRGRIIAKLQSRVIINPETMAEITKNFTGVEVKIIELIRAYTFGVEADAEFISKAVEINKVIKRIKPSHLAFIVMFNLLMNSNVYIGSCVYVSCVQTINSYELEDINITTQENLFSSTVHVLQNIGIK